MRPLRHFQIFYDEESDTEWISLDEFVTFLRSKRHPFDKIKDTKRFNVKREVSSHGHGVKVIDGKESVKVVCVLRYMFNHYYDLACCRALCDDIQNYVLKTKGRQQAFYPVQTKLELYKNIAESDFPFPYSCDDIQKLNLDFVQRDHVITDHKVQFTDAEWAKILLFEQHFLSHYPESTDYEEELKQRWSYYHYCKNIHTVAKQLNKTSKDVIRNRSLRQAAGNDEKEIEFHAMSIHLASRIDTDLLHEVSNVFPGHVGKIITTGDLCTLMKNTVGVCIELESNDLSHPEEICSTILHHLKLKHNLACDKILMYPTNAFDGYISKDGFISRFTLRDHINSRQFFVEPLFVYCPKPEVLDQQDEDLKCSTCYNTFSVQPLSFTNFNIFQEWHLDIPLEMQIFLSSFINHDTMRRTKDATAYLHQKYQRLYEGYDVLLNTLSKQHCGIFQQANTEELLMNYKNVNALFAITSASGTTTSLVSAEENMHMRAKEELRYFNSYMKRHQLHYETLAGDCQKTVSMRECHILLMIDNLVRLRYHKDPNPGENRSQQMCTLPVTLLGLPKDSSVIEEWHSATCDNTASCSCKKAQNVDVKMLFSSTASEEQSAHKFQLLSRWGLSEVWNQLTPEQLLIFISHLKQQSSEPANIAVNPDMEADDTDHEDYIESSNDNVQQQLDDSSYENYLEQEFESFDDFSRDNYLEQECEDGSYMDNVSPQDDFRQEETESTEPLHDLLHTAAAVLNDPCMEDNYIPLAMFTDDCMDDISELEQSVGELSLDIQDEEYSETTTEKHNQESTSVLGQFGFKKYNPPTLLCRHPPPATGRDDDIKKLQDVLEDVLVKIGSLEDGFNSNDKIIIGVDNKIGKNLLALKEINKKFESFIPEFPLLHLRKSKITILFSAYKTVGLLSLLKYMRDDDEDDWSLLVSAQHIDKATRHVRRIAVSIHLAFIVKFMSTLDENEALSFLQALKCAPSLVPDKWNTPFEKFMEEGRKANGTFSLHKDILDHSNEVIAINLSERLGGPDGYNLLLSTVKTSLPFLFLNGATSYAPFCTRLLLEHYQAGVFHSNLKAHLYSTPVKTSTKNFALDTRREMDHRDAHKAIRSGSTLSAVTCRMSLVDSLEEIQQMRKVSRIGPHAEQEDTLGWYLTKTDLSHIFRTTELILRRGGISLENDPQPYNVYASEKTVLPLTILDQYSLEVGKYLLARFLHREGISKDSSLSECKADELKHSQIPDALINRAKTSKGITLRRNVKTNPPAVQSEHYVREEQRKKTMSKQVKKLHCLSSCMNTCQALVKPDCSKPKVTKAKGVTTALVKLLKQMSEGSLPESFVQLGAKTIPVAATKEVKIITVEFAGAKFKVTVNSGEQYLHAVENCIIRPLMKAFPDTCTMVICEEKYSFTPDTFKALTREQRKSKLKDSHHHLKVSKDILSDEKFDKKALTTTAVGKAVISSYLAKNMTKLKLKRISLIVDSEYITRGCTCKDETTCECENKYSVPLNCIFNSSGDQKVTEMTYIQQKKGEGEMAQVDWLVESLPDLKEGDAVASIVTSGDIDSIPLHLFTISRMWPRKADGHFRFPVFVILQKPGKQYDVYNITSIIQFLEQKTKDPLISVKVSMILCMGGNDFLPRFYNISHEKLLTTFLSSSKFKESLFHIDDHSIKLCLETYEELIKCLYCSKRLARGRTPNNIPFTEIRQETMKVKSGKGFEFRNPQQWMPPQSALKHLAELVNLQAEYLLTAGCSNAKLPDFKSAEALRQNAGHVEYYFGEDMYSPAAATPVFQHPETDSTVNMEFRKRKLSLTPQKGARKKIPMTSTPRKGKN